MASKDETHHARDAVRNITRPARYPDLSFLELSMRKARSRRTLAASTREAQPSAPPQDRSASNSSAGSGHSSIIERQALPTPESLLSSTSFNKDGLTHLEALRRAKSAYDGDIRRLKDRLALAEECSSALSQLVNALEDLKLVKKQGQASPEGVAGSEAPVHDDEADDPRMHSFRSPMPGVPVDTPEDEETGRIERFGGTVMRDVDRMPFWTRRGTVWEGRPEQRVPPWERMQGGAGEDEEQESAEMKSPAEAEQQARECITAVRVLRARWNAG